MVICSLKSSDPRPPGQFLVIQAQQSDYANYTYISGPCCGRCFVEQLSRGLCQSCLSAKVVALAASIGIPNRLFGKQMMGHCNYTPRFMQFLNSARYGERKFDQNCFTRYLILYYTLLLCSSLTVSLETAPLSSKSNEMHLLHR